jgi:hypothetical protein
VTVANLKQHLNDLARFLEATGGNKVAKDLAAAADGLAPFADKSVADFSKLLALAHEYHTTGKLSPPPKATRAPRATKVKLDAAEVAADIRSLYDRAGNLSDTMEQIDAEVARLTGLQKAGLLVVCERMEMAGMKNKKLDDVRAAIRQKILDRRSSAQREQMIDGPPPGPGGDSVLPESPDNPNRFD